MPSTVPAVTLKAAPFIPTFAVEVREPSSSEEVIHKVEESAAPAPKVMAIPIPVPPPAPPVDKIAVKLSELCEHTPSQIE